MLNMVQMMVYYEDMTPEWALTLKTMNYIFSIIFFVEAVLKLVAFGRSYFNNGWNQFDFGVVFASVFDVCMEFVGDGTSGFLKTAP